MKIQKITKQCREKGIVLLYDYTDGAGVITQWISNGCACWPVDGLPYLELDHITRIMELTDKQMDKMSLQKQPAPQTLDFSDAAPGEVLLDPERIAFSWSGKILQPVSCGAKTYLIDRSLLEPIVAEYDNTELWMRRSTDGGVYFAVKAGMMLVGMVLPVKTDDGMPELLGQIARQL